MKYVVLCARTANGYSAHVPDFRGCIAAAATLEETRQLIREAIEDIPEPASTGEEVEVPVPA